MITVSFAIVTSLTHRYKLVLKNEHCQQKEFAGIKDLSEQLITIEDLEIFKADLLNEIKRLLKSDTE